MSHSGGSRLAALRSLFEQAEEELTRLEGHAEQPLEAALAEADRRLERMVAFAAGVAGTRELEELLEKGLALLLPAIGAERAYLWVRDSEKTSVERFASLQPVDGGSWAYEKLARTASERVTNAPEPLVIVRAAESDLKDDVEAYQLDVGSIACLPYHVEGRPQAVLYVDRRAHQPPFSRSEIKKLKLLADLAFQAVETAVHLREQTERKQHLEMLNHLYQAVSRTLSLDQILDQVASITLDVTKAERAFILLSEGGQITPAAARDRQGPLGLQASKEISRSVCQKVIETREGVYVFDAGADAEFSQKRSVVSLQLHSVVAVPLKNQAGLTGILYIDARTKSLTALEKELGILTAISNVASLAIENARLYRSATTDGLTGLYVRTFFLSRLEEEVRRCRRYGRSVALLVLDIDHFKRFNDTYGHQTGDEVIKLVAAAIKRSLRAGIDLPGRYGGEELVIALLETPLEGAEAVAERIRETIERASLRSNQGEELRVTASIGVAVYPGAAESAAQLFEHADQALYQSKQAGRNRVTVYQPAPEAAKQER
ncbi:MAG: diguanylate cyclase [Candidatus Sericytochromatia bacterium]